MQLENPASGQISSFQLLSHEIPHTYNSVRFFGRNI